MNATNVYIVADCSLSMSGAPEKTQRALVAEMVETLRKAEVTGAGKFTVTLIPFGALAQKWGPYKPGDAGMGTDVANLVARGFGGSTALRDAIGTALQNAAMTPSTPALVSVFTDGEENASTMFGAGRIRGMVRDAEDAGYLTLTLAGPPGARKYLDTLGIPEGNFRPWEGEVEQRRMSADTSGALNAYVAQRAVGQSTSRSFYANPAALTATGVRANTAAVQPSSVKTVTERMAGRSIADFYGAEFSPGKHFYQLVKPEYVQDGKDILLHDRDANEWRVGSRSARTLLSLPETGKIRLHPSTAASRFDIFVQSTSHNRKVVRGQKMVTVP